MCVLLKRGAERKGEKSIPIQHIVLSVIAVESQTDSMPMNCVIVISFILRCGVGGIGDSGCYTQSAAAFFSVCAFGGQAHPLRTPSLSSILAIKLWNEI